MIILDSSAAVEMVRETELGNGFLALMLDNEEVRSVTLFEAEVRNSFWKYVRHGLLSESVASGYVARACNVVDAFCPIADYADEAFLEAVNYGHPVYDMLYLCAARRNNATLFTADRKLMRLCEEAGVACICEVEL